MSVRRHSVPVQGWSQSHGWLGLDKKHVTATFFSMSAVHIDLAVLRGHQNINPAPPRPPLRYRFLNGPAGVMKGICTEITPELMDAYR